jgi:hypothetical protein
VNKKMGFVNVGNLEHIELKVMMRNVVLDVVLTR